jgi:uncharacterized protein with von Willebrand factor type A (vWA) domain
VSQDLAGNVVAFAAMLRGEHDFAIGLGKTHDALRALDVLGLSERARVRAALRTALCSRPEEVDAFDDLFEAFFANELPGIAQPQHARRTRADANESPPDESKPAAPQQPEPRARDESGAAAEAAFEAREESLAEAWMSMHARYSPAAATHDVAVIPQEGLDAAQVRANELVTRIRLGRSLRWTPQVRGPRFDLRRTLRASLHTGGDAIVLHRLGHPLRNPRFVVLLDGSRSMEPYAGAMLQFALALCRRTRRADAFLFSTDLRDVTRDLRDAALRGSYRLGGLGEAWGGGTRIGANLNAFVRRFGSRLTSQTFVIIFSDGLDVGEIPDLERAMREIARRSAAIAWVNPHAGEPGYAPSVRGMQAALPYVDVFVGMDDLDALAAMARRGGAAA